MNTHGAGLRRLGWLASILSLATLFLCDSSASAADEDLLACAVRIRYERSRGNDLVTGHGTAFGVDLAEYGYAGRKYLLSAAHNVLDDNGKPYKTLKVEIVEGRRNIWSPVEVVAFDVNLDLCLLECLDTIPAQARLAEKDAGVGAAVTLAGSPRGVPVGLFQGVVATRFHQGSVRSLMRIPFDHGDSGGPVFDAQTGKLTGVAVAGVPKDGDLDHAVGLFVPLAGVTGFLDTIRRPGAAGGLAQARPAVPAIKEAALKEAAQPATAPGVPAGQIRTSSAPPNRPPHVTVDRAVEIIEMEFPDRPASAGYSAAPAAAPSRPAPARRAAPGR